MTQISITLPAVPADYLVLEWTATPPSPGLDWGAAPSGVSVEFDDGSPSTIFFTNATTSPSFYPGWEGLFEVADPDPYSAYVRLSIRPVGGWAPGDYGVGGDPIGIITFASFSDAEFNPPLTTTTGFAFEIEEAPPDPDEDPPFVDSEVPPPGAAGVAASTPAGFEIHDLDSGVALSTVVVTVLLAGGGFETIYDGDDGGYQEGYTGTVEAISDGFAFVFERIAGWPAFGQHRLEVYGEDAEGNDVTHAWLFRTSTSPVASWCTQVTRWLLAQFQRLPIWHDVLCVIMAEVQALELAIAEVREYSCLDLAFGRLLDREGESRDFPRETGLDDEAYRALLRAVDAAHASDGSPDSMIAILQELIGDANTCALHESFPAGLYFDIAQPVADGARYARILRRAKPATVGFHLRWLPAGRTIQYFDTVPMPAVGSPTNVSMARASSGA